MKYNVGDKFVIEIGNHMTNENGDLYGIKGFKSLVFDDNGLDKLEKQNKCAKGTPGIKPAPDYPKDPYELGLQDAWKAANKIMSIEIHERAAMFGVSHNKACFKDISDKFSAEEAMKKLAEYGKKKEIRLGDLVTFIFNGIERRGVIWGIDEDGLFIIVTRSGGTYRIFQSNIVKIDMHCPTIEIVLDEIKD